jgi:hypothetical protein
VNAPNAPRRGLLAALASLPIFSRVGAAGASAGQTHFELVPTLQVGETRHFRIVSRSERNGVLAQEAHWPIRVRVVEKSDDSALLHWTQGPTQIVGADPRMRPMLEAMAELVTGATAELRFDRLGRLVDLENVRDMRGLCWAGMERSLKALAAVPGWAEAIPAVRQAMQAAMGSEDLVRDLVLKEPRILFGAMGRRYGAETPLEVRTTLSSPLGGGEIPVIGRFAVRRVEPRRHRAELGWLMASDRRAAADAAEAAVEEIMADMELEPPEGMQLPETLDLDDRADFVIDTRSAWPLSVHFTRRLNAGGQQRVDTVLITSLGD